MTHPSGMGYLFPTPKPPCLFPLPDGRRCLECDTCQGYAPVKEQLTGVRLKRDDIILVVSALLELANESQGPKTLDEMHPDALIPHSNGYSFWFISPNTAKLGTAPLSTEEIADRVKRRLKNES